MAENENKNLNENENLKYAREMFKHEHTRWNHHMLLFLGIIGSIVLAFNSLSELFPKWSIFCLTSLIGFIWSIAIVANRRSTWAWQKVILYFEKDLNAEKKPFELYQEYNNDFNGWKEFFLLDLEDGKEKNSYKFLRRFFSVTRSYQFLALVITGFSVFGAVMSLFASAIDLIKSVSKFFCT